MAYEVSQVEVNKFYLLSATYNKSMLITGSKIPSAVDI